jgi:hypothetical protein
VRLQLVASRFADERGQNPGTVIVPPWDDAALWSIGSPSPSRARRALRRHPGGEARTAASSRRPTRAWTQVPSGSASALTTSALR